MSRAYLCLVLLTVAGCAGNRDNVTVDSAAALAASPGATAQTANAQPNAAPTVVDGNQLAARAATTPICRDVLRRNSNVHVTECRTAAQWKLYQRAEAEAAGDLVRQLQGSGLRR